MGYALPEVEMRERSVGRGRVSGNSIGKWVKKRETLGERRKWERNYRERLQERSTVDGERKEDS